MKIAVIAINERSFNELVNIRRELRYDEIHSEYIMISSIHDITQVVIDKVIVAYGSTNIDNFDEIYSELAEMII